MLGLGRHRSHLALVRLRSRAGAAMPYGEPRGELARVVWAGPRRCAAGEPAVGICASMGTMAVWPPPLDHQDRYRPS